jgi:hypothetical protein
MIRRLKPETVSIGRLRRRLASIYALDFNRTFESLLFVSGTGRSGTTWLVDLLNADGLYRIIFEPFMPGCRALDGRSVPPRYIRPTSRDPDLIATAERILLARFRSSRWTSRGNDRLVSRRRIVKEVQSNLRLGWLREVFPPFPIVLIIRHPCAVAASRGRLGDRRSIDELLDDPALVEDYLAPHVPELRRLESPFEYEVARWCIETHVPLAQLAQGVDIEVVLYEQLVADPVGVVTSLLERLGLEPPARLAETAGVPSHTAYRANKPLEDPTRARDEWQEHLSDREVGRALELVAMFDLDWLYGPEVEPRVDRVGPQGIQTRSP